MEERKNLLLSSLVGLWIQDIKQSTIPYEYIQEESGGWSCWTDFLNVHGTGATPEECVADMISAMRDSTFAYLQDLPFWVKKRPDEIPSILKVSLSTDEELLSCLRGTISTDG